MQLSTIVFFSSSFQHFDIFQTAPIFIFNSMMCWSDLFDYRTVQSSLFCEYLRKNEIICKTI